MRALKARVKGGRLRLDVPTRLPEGTEVPLAVADDGDELTASERRRLERAIDEGWAEIRAGKGIPAKDVIRRLRARG